jgi:acyl transferase domain-containing protein
VAIGDLYEDLNLVPSAVVGHSSGEIAAAYVVPLPLLHTPYNLLTSIAI